MQQTRKTELRLLAKRFVVWTLQVSLGFSSVDRTEERRRFQRRVDPSGENGSHLPFLRRKLSFLKADLS